MYEVQHVRGRAGYAVVLSGTSPTEHGRTSYFLFLFVCLSLSPDDEKSRPVRKFRVGLLQTLRFLTTVQGRAALGRSEMPNSPVDTHDS